MTSSYEIAHRHLEAALAEGGRHGVPPDTMAGILISDAVRVLKSCRSLEDIKSELAFVIDNLEDRDYEFMRP